MSPENAKKAVAELVDNPWSVADGQVVDTSPTEPLKDAGNYRKGHVRLDGMEVSIENPMGSVRRGVSASGKAWQSSMKSDYGYLRGTKGADFKKTAEGRRTAADRDCVDVFIKAGYKGGGRVVHIVNQNDPETGSFDEHKCVLGASSAEEASRIYLANYEQGWKGLGSVVPMSLHDFKAWVYSKEPMKGPAPDPHGWIGVDLDGTLARYDGWGGDTCIGDPVPAMLERVLGWLEAGRDVRIFSARAHEASEACKAAVSDWCLLHLGRDLPLTCAKDKDMAQLWDDRAVSVLSNTGRVVKAASVLESLALSQAQASMDASMAASDAALAEEGGEECGGHFKLAGSAAAGIPDREDYGDLSALPAGKLVQLLVQRHRADRAGLHNDIRLGTPETGYFSWATKKPVPGPGERRQWFRQPLHSREGAEFEGEIPEGYGKGSVSMLDRGEALVLSATPDEVDLVVAHRKHPEYIKLVRSGDGWLAVNHTPTDPEAFLGSGEAFEKPHYKEVGYGSIGAGS
jgi:hypothetical protein